MMTTGVITIRKDALISDAMKKMIKRRVTSLIVEKKGRGCGIITRRDIVNKVIAHGKNPLKVKVSKIMSEPLLTIPADMEITNVARLMARIGIRRFPVIENNRLIGMVSNSDILRAVTLEGL